MVPLIISSTFFWIDISILSSVIVHPSLHKTPIDIYGAIFVLGEMWICIACLLRTGIWSVAICVYSVVIPSGSLAFISFSIITGAIVFAFLGVYSHTSL